MNKKGLYSKRNKTSIMTGPDASMQRENKRLEEQLRSKDSELEKINSLYGDAECKLETAIINNKNFNEKIINLEKELNSSKKDHLILETKQNKFLVKHIVVMPG